MSAGFEFRRALVSRNKGTHNRSYESFSEIFSKYVQRLGKYEKASVLSHVEAIAPATSANLGAGFDVFGVALSELFDTVAVDVVKSDNKVKVFVEGRNPELVPTDPEKNTAGIVAKALMKISGKNCGLVINIKKGVRPGSGLGSSAASAAASALAVNEALQLGLTRRELVKFAALGEVAAAGVPHADNVSAAILGFFTVIISHDPFEVLQLPMPGNAAFVIATPESVLETSKARSVLPKQVPLSDAVHNISRAAAFVAGALLNNLNLMGMGMSDLIAEPYRTKLIPGLADVKRGAIEAGAAGVAISGSGPSVLALVDLSKKVETEVLKAMKEGFGKHGIECETMVTKPGLGAKIVRRE
jgi:homoserine kinase